MAREGSLAERAGGGQRAEWGGGVCACIFWCVCACARVYARDTDRDGLDGNGDEDGAAGRERLAVVGIEEGREPRALAVMIISHYFYYYGNNNIVTLRKDGAHQLAARIGASPLAGWVIFLLCRCAQSFAQLSGGAFANRAASGAARGGPEGNEGVAEGLVEGHGDGAAVHDARVPHCPRAQTGY